MNGSEVWDGGGATLQVHSEEQTTSLEQCHSVDGVPQEQAEEEEKAQGLQKENGERVTEIQESQSEETEDVQKKEAIVGDQKEEIPFPTEKKRKELQEVGTPLPERNRKKERKEELEGSMTQLEEFGMVQAQVSEKEDLQRTGVTEEPELKRGAPAGSGGLDSDQGAGSAEADLGEQQETSSSVLDLSALLSETNVQPWENFAQPLYTGWHFPTGSGLGEVVHCPSWQFSGMSYYPQQEMTSFEGECIYSALQLVTVR